MIASLFLLIIGFIILIYGATTLINGATSLAKRLGIPAIVIGLTIVAFGTSAPELFVNIFASIYKTTDISLGNVIGSNIFNVLIILGLTSIIMPLEVKTNTTWIEVPLCLIAALLVWICGNDSLIEGRVFSEISRIDGIVFLIFFLIFIIYNYYLSKNKETDGSLEIKKYTIVKTILFITAGIAMLASGGHLIVNSAVKIARYLNISERLIGLTIVSMGTSLPELATSIIAARKKNLDIAIGNIVGSNIFNIFFILGTSAVIYPLPVNYKNSLDMLFNIFISLLLFLFIFTGKGRKVERWEGAIFVSLYAIYLFYLIFSH